MISPENLTSAALAVIAVLIPTALVAAEPALPPQLSGTWCYDRPMGGGRRIEGDVYERSEEGRCAHDGGFAIWPDGRGWTYVRFDEVNDACKFEKVDRIKSSDEGEAYELRLACDRAREFDEEDDEIELIDIIMLHDGNDRLILSNPPEG